MRRLAPAVVGLLAMAGCAGSTGPGPTAEVASVGSVDVAGGDAGVEVEVLQGTVTGVADTGDRVEVLVRLAWAPVLRAENRTLQVHIGPGTRFLPGASRHRLREGDEVQVSVPSATPETGSPGPAAEITLLDLD